MSDNKIDNISEVDDIGVAYKSHQLEYESCQNSLVGNFDKNFQYKIYDIIIPELIKIEKTIEEKTNDKYVAYAVIEKTKLKFIVSLEKSKDDIVSATLKLVEKVVVANTFTTTITTSLQTIADYDSPNFLYKVRKAFHLVNEGDYMGKGDVNEYISPPIELLTEILRKKQLLEKLQFNRETAERKYIAEILQELRKTENGTVVVKNFVKAIKANKLEEVKLNKLILYRQLLDKILEEEATMLRLEKEQLKKIQQIRTIYIEEIKTESKNYDKKAENESILGNDTQKPKTEAKSSSASKSSSSGKSSGGKSGGGGNKGGGGKSKGGKDDKKDDKKKEERELYLKDLSRKKIETKAQSSAKEDVVQKNAVPEKSNVAKAIEPVNAEIKNEEGINEEFLHDMLLNNMKILDEKIKTKQREEVIVNPEISEININATESVVKINKIVSQKGTGFVKTTSESIRISNMKSLEKDK